MDDLDRKRLETVARLRRASTRVRAAEWILMLSGLGVGLLLRRWLRPARRR